ncbi:MAG TPA: hypothetical protein PL157_11655, partial [Acidobacteriota bacterium]|nr:hypothetical protein [Acidobacteriota bacterium]
HHRANTGLRGKQSLTGSWMATFSSADNPLSFPPLPALFTFACYGMLIQIDGGKFSVRFQYRSVNSNFCIFTPSLSV